MAPPLFYEYVAPFALYNISSCYKPSTAKRWKVKNIFISPLCKEASELLWHAVILLLQSAAAARQHMLYGAARLESSCGDGRMNDL
jgi:hypothetical protein